VDCLGKALTMFSCNAGVVHRVIYALKQIARRGGSHAREEACDYKKQIREIEKLHPDNKAASPQAHQNTHAASLTWICPTGYHTGSECPPRGSRLAPGCFPITVITTS